MHLTIPDIPAPQVGPPGSDDVGMILSWLGGVAGFLCLMVMLAAALKFSLGQLNGDTGHRPPPAPPKPQPAAVASPVNPKHHDLTEYLKDQDKAYLKGWDDLVNNLAVEPDPKDRK